MFKFTDLLKEKSHKNWNSERNWSEGKASNCGAGNWWCINTSSEIRDVVYLDTFEVLQFPEFNSFIGRWSSKDVFCWRKLNALDTARMTTEDRNQRQGHRVPELQWHQNKDSKIASHLVYSKYLSLMRIMDHDSKTIKIPTKEIVCNFKINIWQIKVNIKEQKSDSKAKIQQNKMADLGRLVLWSGGNESVLWRHRNRIDVLRMHSGHRLFHPQLTFSISINRVSPQLQR